MVTQFLADGRLTTFLEILATGGVLYGPVLNDDGVVVLSEILPHSDLELDYRRTLLPPKKYLFPPRQTMLNYCHPDGYRLPELEMRKIILFGIHPCDLQGIAYLDRVFLGEQPDPLYNARRSATMLVGLSCEPDEYCFCDDNGVNPEELCDLFLTRTTTGYFLTPHSVAGEGVLASTGHLLTTKAPPVTSYRVEPLMKTIRQVAAHGDTFPENPLWDEFSSRCLSCGACSVCCPTCYCFDVLEQGKLDGKSAERLQEWDNCLYQAHGQVAGGTNFRPTRLDRLRYRFMHKYIGFGRMAGVVSCVGCGRCREACPVDIDLTAIMH